jgi:hypothetical protein
MAAEANQPVDGWRRAFLHFTGFAGGTNAFLYFMFYAGISWSNAYWLVLPIGALYISIEEITSTICRDQQWLKAVIDWCFKTGGVASSLALAPLWYRQ